MRSGEPERRPARQHRRGTGAGGSPPRRRHRPDGPRPRAGDRTRRTARRRRSGAHRHHTQRRRRRRHRRRAHRAHRERAGEERAGGHAKRGAVEPPWRKRERERRPGAHRDGGVHCGTPSARAPGRARRRRRSAGAARRGAAALRRSQRLARERRRGACDRHRVDHRPHGNGRRQAPCVLSAGALGAGTVRGAARARALVGMDGRHRRRGHGAHAAHLARHRARTQRNDEHMP